MNIPLGIHRAIDRKRNSWECEKETIKKILRLTKEFGLGVVFYIPAQLTYSYFERMTVIRIVDAVLPTSTCAAD